MESSDGEARLLFEGGPATAVSASLVTNQMLSVLSIVTGEDDVELFLNGSKYRRTTKNGRLSVYLPPKSYTVRVQKNGMMSPPPQTVELRRGQDSQVEFKIAASKATLAVHYGIVGSEVWVDGNRIGIVGADGEFAAAYIDPGKHIIAVRHERYKPLQSEQVFAAAKSIDLDGTLQTLYGTLRIEIAPGVPEAHLHLRRQDEGQDREIKETSLSLLEGTYTITASAPRYQDATETVRVTGGNTATVTLPMKRIETPAGSKAPVEAAQPAFGLSNWLKLGGWTRDGEAIRRQGGGLCSRAGQPHRGDHSVHHSVAARQTYRVGDGFADAKNYYQFQIDDSNFSRAQVADGKHSKTVRAQHGAKREQYNAFTIKITAKEIVTSIQRGGSWHTLDTWEPPGGPAPGKFGFHIQGRDEIGLTDFKLTQP